MPKQPLSTLCLAAHELGSQLILNDPTDEVILVAAAELAGDNSTDLALMPINFRGAIVAAYECGVRGEDWLVRSRSSL